MEDEKWKKETIELSEDHAWVARPGCKVFVLERGAVRFDYPQDWVVQPADDSIELYDKPHPDDDCRLAVSYLSIPPIDWSGLPLSDLLIQAGGVDTRRIHRRSEIQARRRGDLEYAWREVRFFEGDDRCEVCSLMCMARRGRVQALLTFDFWADDQERCLKVWATVLDTLVLDVEYDYEGGHVGN